MLGILFSTFVVYNEFSKKRRAFLVDRPGEHPSDNSMTDSD